MSVAIAMQCTGLIGCAEVVRLILEAVALVATVIGGAYAVRTYHRSVKLERAKWVKDLYDKFYEHDKLKEVRNKLDSDDEKQIRSMVEEESAAFTDYLNFFEFLGYLWESKQIKKCEILGLFDYYLRNLMQNEAVAAYIADPTKGFEKLQKLLSMVEEVDRK
jgi:hypothetical protein